MACFTYSQSSPKPFFVISREILLIKKLKHPYWIHFWCRIQIWPYKGRKNKNICFKKYKYVFFFELIFRKTLHKIFNIFFCYMVDLYMKVSQKNYHENFLLYIALIDIWRKSFLYGAVMVSRNMQNFNI